ncbi:hypothetical protein ACLOJK_041111 [Asimina triloba]
MRKVSTVDASNNLYGRGTYLAEIRKIYPSAPQPLCSPFSQPFHRTNQMQTRTTVLSSLLAFSSNRSYADSTRTKWEFEGADGRLLVEDRDVKHGNQMQTLSPDVMEPNRMLELQCQSARPGRGGWVDESLQLTIGSLYYK